MEKNQRDQNGQQQDIKTIQSSSPDYRKREIDPNNPVADNNSEKGWQKENRSNSDSAPGRTNERNQNSEIQDTEDRDEETTGRDKGGNSVEGKV